MKRVLKFRIDLQKLISNENKTNSLRTFCIFLLHKLKTKHFETNCIQKYHLKGKQIVKLIAFFVVLIIFSK